MFSSENLQKAKQIQNQNELKHSFKYEALFYEEKSTRKAGKNFKKWVIQSKKAHERQKEKVLAKVCKACGHVGHGRHITYIVNKSSSNYFEL